MRLMLLKKARNEQNFYIGLYKILEINALIKQAIKFQLSCTEL